MKLRLEATKAELADTPRVLMRLSKALGAQCPDLSAALRKAALAEGTRMELRHPAMQESLEHVRSEYASMVDAMLDDVVEVVDSGE